MSYEQKMMAMKKMLKKAPTSTSTPKQTPIKPAVPHYCEAWEAAGLKAIYNDFGMCFVREQFYPHDTVHGNFMLGDLQQALADLRASGIAHPLVPSADVMFFDTETTGLKGVGTQIFILGELHCEADGFRLKQYIQADPANEAAMLFASTMWRGKEVVVTYNGKSFDWPQLTTRFTLHRAQLPKLAMREQLDLLHTARRLWREDVASMKLSAIEQHKLGFTRVDDIPGFLAPIIYADAVRSGNPTSLLKVLVHNEWDLLSLVTLYTHAIHLILQQQQESAKTYTNIGKWYGDLKAHDTSAQVLTQVTERYAVADTYEAYYYLALQQKRAGEFAHARDSFLKALPQLNEVQRLNAHEHLAKLYEHQFMVVEAALAHCNAGLQLIASSTRLKDEARARRLFTWQKRKLRLTRKQSDKDDDIE